MEHNEFLNTYGIVGNEHVPKKVRNYVFTVNNKDLTSFWIRDDIEKLIKAFEEDGARYVVIGIERGGINKRSHMQGCVCYNNARAKKPLIEFLKKHTDQHPWVAAMKGTPKQAADYCKKEDNFLEYGEQPLEQEAKGAKSAERSAHIIELAKQGDLATIMEMYPSEYLRMYNTLQRIKAENASVQKNLADVCGIWIHGPSGVGKSHLPRSVGIPYYDKPFNKWWDCNKGELMAIMDDADPRNTEHLHGYIKRWCDRYPLNVEIKNSAARIRPEFVVITSQYSIEECFAADPKSVEAVARRCKQIFIPTKDARAIARMQFEAILVEMRERNLEFDGELEGTKIVLPTVPRSKRSPPAPIADARSPISSPRASPLRSPIKVRQSPPRSAVSVLPRRLNFDSSQFAIPMRDYSPMTVAKLVNNQEAWSQDCVIEDEEPFLYDDSECIPGTQDSIIEID